MSNLKVRIQGQNLMFKLRLVKKEKLGSSHIEIINIERMSNKIGAARLVFPSAEN
jgi:hypothetical protein